MAENNPMAFKNIAEIVTYAQSKFIHVEEIDSMIEVVEFENMNLDDPLDEEDLNKILNQLSKHIRETDRQFNFDECLTELKNIIPKTNDSERVKQALDFVKQRVLSKNGDITDQVMFIEEHVFDYFSIPKSKTNRIGKPFRDGYAPIIKEKKKAIEKTISRTLNNAEREESEEEGEEAEYTLSSLEERLKAYPEKVINRANKILDRGRALKFMTKTFNKLHVGDTNLGELLICSAACTQVANARMGNHQKPSGDPEAGKTHALKSAGKLLPTWKYRETTFSPKVLYYMKDLLPGTIIFTDDINLEDEGVISTVKKRTADFSEPVYLDTIIDGKPAKLIIPERINFWFSSVDSMNDVQFATRFYVTNTENGKEHNHKVNHIQKSRCLGAWHEVINEDVLVCRCMFEYICSELHTVFSAYGFVSNWSDESKKRNFDKFMDLLFSVTVLNYRQREKNENGELISNLEDWKTAVRIYAPIASNTSLMLTDEEITILYAIHQLNNVLEDDDGVPLRRIFACLKNEKKFSKSIDTMRKIITGNGKDSKGFKEKVPGFSADKVDKCKLDEQGYEKKGEGKTHTWCYKYDGDIFDDIPKDTEDIITYIKNRTFVTCDYSLADELALIYTKEPNFVYKISQNVKLYENWKKTVLDNPVSSKSSDSLRYSQMENDLQSETSSQLIANNYNNNNNILSYCKKMENTLCLENCVYPTNGDTYTQNLSPCFFAQSEQSEQSEALVLGNVLQSENLTLQSEQSDHMKTLIEDIIRFAKNDYHMIVSDEDEFVRNFNKVYPVHRSRVGLFAIKHKVKMLKQKGWSY